MAEGAPLLREYVDNTCIVGSNPTLTEILNDSTASVAQLDRALGYELRGRRFESFRMRTKNTDIIYFMRG